MSKQVYAERSIAELHIFLITEQHKNLNKLLKWLWLPFMVLGFLVLALIPTGVVLGVFAILMMTFVGLYSLVMTHAATVRNQLADLDYDSAARSDNAHA